MLDKHKAVTEGLCEHSLQEINGKIQAIEDVSILKACKQVKQARHFPGGTGSLGQTHVSASGAGGG